MCFYDVSFLSHLGMIKMFYSNIVWPQHYLKLNKEKLISNCNGLGPVVPWLLSMLNWPVLRLATFGRLGNQN